MQVRDGNANWFEISNASLVPHKTLLWDFLSFKRCCFALLDSALHLHFCCRGGNIAEEFDTRNFSMNVAEGVRWWRESCRQLRRCEVD